MRRFMSLVLAVAGCASTAAEDGPTEDRSPPAPPPPAAAHPPVPPPAAAAPEAEKPPLLFPIPKKGVHVDVTADAAALGCSLRVDTRSYDFPASMLEPAVSITGKGMCAHDATTIHCHVSG